MTFIDTNKIRTVQSLVSKISNIQQNNVKLDIIGVVIGKDKMRKLNNQQYVIQFFINDSIQNSIVVDFYTTDFQYATQIDKIKVNEVIQFNKCAVTEYKLNENDITRFQATSKYLLRLNKESYKSSFEIINDRNDFKYLARYPLTDEFHDISALILHGRGVINKSTNLVFAIKEIGLDRTISYKDNTVNQYKNVNILDLFIYDDTHSIYLLEVFEDSLKEMINSNCVINETIIYATNLMIIELPNPFAHMTNIAYKCVRTTTGTCFTINPPTTKAFDVFKKCKLEQDQQMALDNLNDDQ